MKTAVVILNWNTAELLERFLPGVLRSTAGLDAEVVVADNGSTDNSLDVLKASFPQVRVVALDKNYGFVGGYNLALEQIEAEYYVLLNTDVKAEGSWLSTLQRWMDTHPDCGVCGPKLLSFSEPDRFEYAGAAGGYLDSFGYPYCRGRVLSHTAKDEGQYDSPKDVMWVSGACLMVRSALYHKLSGLDFRFFAHMEEIDLCWRVQLHGWKVTVVPEAEVWHIGGGTLSSGSAEKLRLNYRNNLIMLENNLAKTYAVELFDRWKGASVTDRMERHLLRKKAAKKGARKAARLIFVRKMLDGCSAMIYLCTGRLCLYKAVVAAHKSYKSLYFRWSARQISDSMKASPGARVIGFGHRAAILGAILRGKRYLKSID